MALDGHSVTGLCAVQRRVMEDTELYEAVHVPDLDWFAFIKARLLVTRVRDDLQFRKTMSCLKIQLQLIR